MSESFQQQLSILKDLQEIDLNLHKFQQVLAELPTRLNDAKLAFEQKAAERDAAKAELNATLKQKATDEKTVEDSAQFLREREAKLYAIKTNKEYQAALKEISDGKRSNRELEDRVIQYMEKIEALTKNCEQLNSEAAEKESVFTKVQADVNAEEEKIRADMKDFETRRPTLVAKLDKVLLRKYDFIRKRYVLALVAVKDGACQGCLRRIPPQMYNEMLRNDEQKNCPQCQRLLYIEVASEPQEKSE